MTSERAQPTDVDSRIYGTLRAFGEVSTTRLMILLAAPHTTILKACRRLEERGKVRCLGLRRPERNKRSIYFWAVNQ